jgi:ribose 5-phosphate isomerase A
MDQEDAKRLAAERALELLPDAGVLGLGTGSTTKWFIEGVARLVRQGRSFSGVPTSQESRARAAALGIPLLGDEGPWDIDLCVDGADEVSEALDLIKGGGGAHTREKVVNYAARKNVIIVDESKLSRRLGERRAVPVEVLAFAHLSTAAVLGRFGTARLRLGAGKPFVTDSGNYIYDLSVEPIAAPDTLDLELCRIPGVVDTGLFCGRADLVIVAGRTGVRMLHK